jgi:hypothetical protein
MKLLTLFFAPQNTIPRAADEIENIPLRTSQWREGEEIPEKHWMYYLAKKFFFNDFGVYRGLEKQRGGEGDD